MLVTIEKLLKILEIAKQLPSNFDQENLTLLSNPNTGSRNGVAYKKCRVYNLTLTLI